MSDDEPRRPASDPVHHEAEDWAAAGLPEQEDTTEDTVLPGQEPVPLGEEGAGGTEREAGESHDAALARERPDVGGDASPGVIEGPGRADEEETEPGVDRSEAGGPGVEGAAVMDTSETGTLGDAPTDSVRQRGAGRVGPTEDTPSTTARLVEPDEGTARHGKGPGGPRGGARRRRARCRGRRGAGDPGACHG
ncbi:hypothetical protein J4H86_14500 [Spiractinospora alimapuensis]|nr:hypothetical protein [Spiractinospora alimapuensis]QVQ50168.1 hypothetical protein J4H86_14500 [Spiractinospora alimapuensis]